jgi:hypothetical protein
MLNFVHKSLKEHSGSLPKWSKYVGNVEEVRGSGANLEEQYRSTPAVT